MAQTKAKQQTPHTTPQAVPPTPTHLPLQEDDEAPISPSITIDDSGMAFAWLEGIADLLAIAPLDELDSQTARCAGELMYAFAEAGHACYRREREEWKQKVKNTARVEEARREGR